MIAHLMGPSAKISGKDKKMFFNHMSAGGRRPGVAEWWLVQSPDSCLFQYLNIQENRRQGRLPTVDTPAASVPTMWQILCMHPYSFYWER